MQMDCLARGTGEWRILSVAHLLYNEVNKLWYSTGTVACNSCKCGGGGGWGSLFNCKWHSSPLNHFPPHEPPLQASSSPIPWLWKMACCKESKFDLNCAIYNFHLDFCMYIRTYYLVDAVPGFRWYWLRIKQKLTQNKMTVKQNVHLHIGTCMRTSVHVYIKTYIEEHAMSTIWSLELHQQNNTYIHAWIRTYTLLLLQF